jgi:hypothetical protein
MGVGKKVASPCDDSGRGGERSVTVATIQHAVWSNCSSGCSAFP